ncbi:uncharacterized protein LOC119086019 [Bradysia coprophila]|uniref:uncharacterized protein LOC119086019 n=1 Tax=Bradysia coprophila TaxID=38358 RepID=UPI00187D79AD|nr:uncharacterized protein LOC119086019 [Bradysia coprophila]
MENIATWILAVTSILYNQVVCSDNSNDFEVLYTSAGFDGLKSQSLSADDQRFTRNAFDPKTDYVGSHNAFLWKYFDKAADYTSHDGHDDDDDDGHVKTNEKYHQAPDAEQFEKVDSYDQAYNDYQYDRIRSMSPKQNQESEQNPKNCKIVVNGAMICSVCKDSDGNHSKSCSFSSAPDKQNYEYIKQRMTAYNSGDHDE